MKKKKAGLEIHIGMIHYGDGNNYYAARSEKLLRKKLANYCRKWWGNNRTQGNAPKGDAKVIEAYFHPDGNEWMETSTDTI